MELTHHIEDGICKVLIDGNVALDGVDEVKSYLQPFLDDESIKGLIINCKKIAFIDSSGIGFVVSTFKSLENRNAKFALCHLSDINLEIFKMAQLNTLINIVGTEEEALASFNVKS